ncbi:hypothetical protein ACWEOZ_35980 [Actinoplanes sp. NPDC004185]
MTSVHVRVAGPGEHLDEAALIWAEATAASPHPRSGRLEQRYRLDL